MNLTNHLIEQGIKKVAVWSEGDGSHTRTPQDTMLICKLTASPNIELKYIISEKSQTTLGGAILLRPKQILCLDDVDTVIVSESRLFATEKFFLKSRSQAEVLYLSDIINRIHYYEMKEKRMVETLRALANQSIKVLLFRCAICKNGSELSSWEKSIVSKKFRNGRFPRDRRFSEYYNNASLEPAYTEQSYRAHLINASNGRSQLVKNYHVWKDLDTNTIHITNGKRHVPNAPQNAQHKIFLIGDRFMILMNTTRRHICKKCVASALVLSILFPSLTNGMTR